MDTRIDERVFGKRLSQGMYSGFKEIEYHFMGMPPQALEIVFEV